MIDLWRLCRSRAPGSRVARFAWLLLVLGQPGCFRGKLPPREFYRLVPVDSLTAAPSASGAPPLTGAIAIIAYDTPGIYDDGALVYRVDGSGYGKYPSREWAVPLGEMLAARTEAMVGARALTSGRVAFDRSGARREPYEWRGVVREFDEVDGAASVSASVSLVARLVRVADDSVVWSGAAHEVEPVLEARKINSVIAALSVATSRAIARLADDAGSTLRRLAAAPAQLR